MMTSVYMPRRAKFPGAEQRAMRQRSSESPLSLSFRTGGSGRSLGDGLECACGSGCRVSRAEARQRQQVLQQPDAPPPARNEGRQAHMRQSRRSHDWNPTTVREADGVRCVRCH